MTERSDGAISKCVMSTLVTSERYSKALMEGKRKLVSGFDVPDTDQTIIELNTKKSG